jgi:hypothetical protein
MIFFLSIDQHFYIHMSYQKYVCHLSYCNFEYSISLAKESILVLDLQC